MLVSANNTKGAGQGDGYILHDGHQVWEKLGSTGANSCVIIGAWVPDQRVLALCHFDIFTNDIASVWAKIDHIRQGSSVKLYMASNFFKQLATSQPHGAIINWFDRLSYANSLTTYRSLRLAISVSTGEATTRFQAKDIFMGTDSNAWLLATKNAIKPIRGETVASKKSSSVYI